MKKCLLSVAMIVKDEEHNIRRALESVKEVVDEIVVVDTGSKDRTPQIVKEYTDKLYFHEWRNDLSEARNFSLQFPTCEWVLILDADEEASREFREKIRDFLEKLPQDVNTVYVPILSYLDWDFKRTEIASVPRIFRNGTVHFENIVHEQPVYKPKVVHAPFMLLHYGYIWSRKLRKQKYERNASLIREQLKNTKNPLERIYYLAQLYKTEVIGGKSHEANRIAWETLKEMEKVKEIPPIGLEFLYLFGLRLIVEGFFEKGRQLIELALRAFPDNPDPYFGMVAYHERKKDWEDVLEWGEKFLEVLERALSKKEEYVFTLMSLKEVGTAHLLMCHACVKLGRMEEAHDHLLKAIENRVDPEKFSLTLKVLAEVEDRELFEKAFPMIEELAKVDGLSFDPVVEKMAELDLKVPEGLLDKLRVSSRIASLAVERLKTGRDMLYEFLTSGDLDGFLKRTGVPGLLTIFDILRAKESEARLIRVFSKVQGDERLVGVAQAIVGDLYLRLGNFQEAISRYRKAIETLPEIARFVKPVIEDLKTRLDPETEGVFEELHSYFNERREFLLDVPSMFGEETEKLHLISDHPLALYASAVAISSKDREKAKKLLERISNPKRFPFYHYRLAKLYEEDDPKRAFELHLKAVEENEKLADIALGRYPYTGLYPSLTLPFVREEHEIAWVGNVSEKFSTLGVVHPVRMWKKGEGFYYCVPFPTDEALKMYEERERETYKTPPFRVDEKTVMEVLATLDVDEVKVYPEGTQLEDLLKDDVRVNASSENLLIVSGVEREIDLSKVLGKSRAVFLFFFSPNPIRRDDPVWYYPAFRVLRTPRQMRKALEEAGYAIERLERKGEGLFFLKAVRKRP